MSLAQSRKTISGSMVDSEQRSDRDRSQCSWKLATTASREARRRAASTNSCRSRSDFFFKSDSSDKKKGRLRGVLLVLGDEQRYTARNTNSLPRAVSRAGHSASRADRNWAATASGP